MIVPVEKVVELIRNNNVESSQVADYLTKITTAPIPLDLDRPWAFFRYTTSGSDAAGDFYLSFVVGYLDMNNTRANEELYDDDDNEYFYTDANELLAYLKH